MLRKCVSRSRESRWVDDGREGDGAVSGTMVGGSQGFASAHDSGAHAPGAGALVRDLAAGPRLDVIGDGGGTGTGPSHHRNMGMDHREDFCTACPPADPLSMDVGLGEGGPVALIFEQAGGSRRPWRDAAGGVEDSGPRTVCLVGHRPGQLELVFGQSGIVS